MKLEGLHTAIVKRLLQDGLINRWARSATLSNCNESHSRELRLALSALGRHVMP